MKVMIDVFLQKFQSLKLLNSLYTKIFLILLLLTLVFFIGRLTSSTKSVTHDSQIASPGLITHMVINKSFDFPVKDNQENVITTIHYTIQSVDISNQVIIKGQLANAIKGETFLIVNIKIVNDSDKAIQINSRDYVRLSVNKNSDLLAADIHNDPVQIQPISTKYTRLGFPINQKDKNLELQIGEIDGKKTIIPLKSF